MKTLDDPTNWEAACLMVVEVALGDERKNRPRKTGSVLIEFVARELNTEKIHRRVGHRTALARIYGAVRSGARLGGNTK
jgi:hypothetical protein